MSPEIQLLLITAASIGFIHTVTGPDHYLPFIMMSKARNWSDAKTAAITFVCGIGHVMSSVVLGLIGVAFGVALVKLELIESFRGDIAAWLLTAFGFTYFVWGVWRVIKNKPHTHSHIHEEGTPHSHEHNHNGVHVHVHEKKANITPWVLFTIFVFGPCEPLIPIIMYPAARESISGMILVAGIFSLTTIGTMMVIVMAASRGLAWLPFGKIERYTHAIAGAAISLCGFAILFLGL